MITRSDLIADAGTLLVPTLLIVAIVRARRQPLWAEAYRRIGRNRVAKGALLVLSLYLLIATLGGIGWHTATQVDQQTPIELLFDRPAEPTYSAPFARTTAEANNPRALKAPGTHILGTDAVGSDVLFQSMKAIHTAVFIGIITTAIATPLALVLGLCGGYFGKITDDVVQYTYTVLFSIPDILLLIAIILILGAGLVPICIALGVTSWVNLCRLVRGETLRHRNREYVLAAKALGVSNARIIARHILPNLLPVVIIYITISFSTIVLSEAILSYLGVGVGPDIPSWGNMIDGARDELTRDPIVWWNLLAASLGLFGLVLSLNLLTDALRDAIDPRLRSS
jgi:peptide/nickel transport system permease protein